VIAVNMSALYNLEPQPTASLILHTTSGDISLSLFAQQTPLTSRNFLQLCLDGYYDNTIFHRLIPGFILQGGDPTGTGHGGSSIYDAGAFGEENGIWPLEDRKGANAGPHGIGFKDEWHSRIKFNRRGLLGMANDGTKDSNGSQFFLTLGDTPELQGKNTCFGRVEGDTIYNLARMGEAEVEAGSERPTYPTKVTGVEVLVNPFKDMVRREKVVRKVVEEKKVAGGKKKRKAGKQLLSFGGDEEGDDPLVLTKKAKFNERIVMEDANAVPEPPSEKTKERKVERRVVKSPTPEASPEPVSKQSLPTRETKAPARDISSSPEPVQKVSSLLERTNAQIAELKASMRRNVTTAPVKEKKKSALEDMIPSHAVRGRKRRPGGNAPTDQRSLDILKAFQAKLDNAPPEKVSAKPEAAVEGDSETNGKAEDDDDEAALCDLHFIANCQSCQKWDTQIAEEEDDVNDKTWMSHALSFKEEKLGRDLSYRKKAEEELVVIDPLAKARTLKEETAAKRAAKSGGSGRAWDQARNEKLARSAALDGRGAR
jgi:peptidyl-prolyl cis-trans isomerase SDCCAG10